MKNLPDFTIYVYVLISPIFILYTLLQGWVLEGVPPSNVELIFLTLFFSIAVASMLAMIYVSYNPIPGWDPILAVLLLASLGYLGYMGFQEGDIPLFFMLEEVVLFMLGVYVLSSIHVLNTLPRIHIYVYLGFAVLPMILILSAYGYILPGLEQQIPDYVLQFHALALVGFIASAAILAMILDPYDLVKYWNAWVLLTPIVISQIAFVATGMNFGGGIGFIVYCSITYVNCILHIFGHELGQYRDRFTV